ncbi:hypothetical protein F511_16242 [Dorcoceras hygrometricum]|uniref:MAR-binding filament-like protein 1 n=1 Tax=Dorcoceras hygrometricum TaxID=472368 RepID=A0A2Z7BM89_9LAMI|nr:hypothetical protein F511_16242 [Dorcoceras hygrometricum]
MATFASIISHPATLSSSRRLSSPSPRRLPALSSSFCGFPRTFGESPSLRARVFVSPPSSPDWGFGTADESPRSKKSALFNLIQEIEPLDVSLIQKDVPPTTIDAMKRTISGMLGLLPSDQFQVVIEALWDPLFKLLISSMMTGYTLRNAEYKLCLERNVEIYEGHVDKSHTEENSRLEMEETLLKSNGTSRTSGQEGLPTTETTIEITSNIPDFGEMTPEAREYILKLHSHLSSAKKEFHAAKRKAAALQMQKFVGEEKNDLLDYLRSLEPEMVAELSESASPGFKDTIHSVVHGLLATLSPKMHSKGSDLGGINSTGTINDETEGDCVDVVENSSLQFQPLISLPRDYLARLLFWCMLLGHYLRGLEYRLELMELLSLSYVAGCDDSNGEVQSV